MNQDHFPPADGAIISKRLCQRILAAITYGPINMTVVRFHFHFV